MKARPKTHREASPRVRRRGNSNDRWYGNRWRDRVRDPFLRQHYAKGDGLCAICKTSLGELGPREVVVDHIVPFGMNRRLWRDRANLQALCKGCHDAKTRKEQSGWQHADG
jgi:5-methylcytosine-specific restriction protein A